ncbi:MAG: SDR family NAD(P)-dependent oxidoreductase, partial [Spirochaetota bacterium]
MNETVLSEVFAFSGNTVAVTGGGGALPGAVAEGLARLGLNVALLDLSVDKAEEKALEIRDAGGSARAYHCDVLSKESILAVREQVQRDFGAVDYLVNGAGGNV